MKKTFIMAFVAVLAGCNSNEPAKTGTDKPTASETAMAPVINSPYAVGYSSSFVAGDPTNAESVLKLWKVWDGGDLSGAKEFFADSVEMHMSDGSIMKGPKDSIVAWAQPYRTSLGTVVSSVDAVMAVKSTDKNEKWALVWGKEVSTDKKGKSDSSYLQETWRFNKDGKTDLMFQYKQAGAAPKK